MSDLVSLHVLVPKITRRALEVRARKEGVSLGHLIRKILAHYALDTILSTEGPKNASQEKP